MNIGALVQTAMNAVPSTLRAAITFTKTTPGAPPTTTTVLGRASEAKADPRKYEALKLTGIEIRTLIFVATTIGEEPSLEMTCLWNNKKFSVKHVEPIAPDGSSVACFVYIGR